MAVMTEEKRMESSCSSCGAETARRYQQIEIGVCGEPATHREFILCARCARAERKRLAAQSEPRDGLTRAELLAALDRFFDASGVFDICRRCHEQGTGCCPSTCRVMGTAGCDPKNKYGKTVFCGAFVCSALLNAISECSPDTGRALKWVKNEVGSAEFPIYEMITRVPREEREPVRPIALPRRYPNPVRWEGAGLTDGAKIKEKLSALAPEVLEIRRRWRVLERQEAAYKVDNPGLQEAEK